MKHIELEYSYKGTRNYVHGTDIYKQIMKNLNILGYDNWQYFELNIKKVTQHNMTCFLSDVKQRHSGEVVNFKLIKDQIQLFGLLIENTEKTIESRYVFNEDDITQHCNIDYQQKSIIYNHAHNTFTPIDIIIAMSRCYLENAVSSSVKWFYRTTKLIRPIDELKIQHVLIKETLRKGIIVEFNIYINNQLIGSAYGASIAN
jgi:hypothetical protein